MSASDKPKSPRQRLHADPHSDAIQIQECLLSRDIPDLVDLGSHAWLGYRRCHDFDKVPKNKGIGQDNAVLWCDDRYAVGVLCDGVSEGFYSDIAARILTDGLIEPLWENRIAPPDAQIVQTWLIAIEKKMAQAVCNFPIPTHLPTMQQELMEETRTNSGSQSVFTAFIWDMDAEIGSNNCGHLHAYQVGDPFCYAFVSPNNAPDALSPQWDVIPNPTFKEVTCRLVAAPHGRVRSIGKSKFHLAYGFLKGVQGIALHSDGIPAQWGATLTNLDTFSESAKKTKKLQLEEWMQSDWAEKDDVSFVVALTSQLQGQLRCKEAVHVLPTLPPHPMLLAALPELLDELTPATPDLAAETGRKTTLTDQPPVLIEEPAKKKPSILPNAHHKTKAPPGPRRVNILASVALLLLVLVGVSAGSYLHNRQDGSVSTKQPGVTSTISPGTMPTSAANPETQPAAAPPPPIDLRQDDGIAEALQILNYTRNDEPLQKSVRRFQAKNGLEVDGDPGERTLARLAAKLRQKKIPCIR